jgi:hypothetical protein
MKFCEIRPKGLYSCHFIFFVTCKWAQYSRVLVPGNPLQPSEMQHFNQGILKGESSMNRDLLFDWFGLVCFANKNKNCQLSYS